MRDQRDSVERINTDADSFRSIPEVFRDRSGHGPEAIAYTQADASLAEESFRSPEDSLPWRDVCYGDLQSEVNRIAGGLAGLGVERGIRAAILSNTRPEWMEAELGIMTAGGSVVTCYTSDPAERIGYVLWDSGAKVVFAENQEQVEKLLQLQNAFIDVPETESHAAGKKQVSFDKIVAFEAVTIPEEFSDLVISLKFLKEQGVENIAALNAENHVPVGSDEATVIYTSGTTGAPKGVVATHSQHLANVRQIIKSGIVDGVKKSFQLLPLAHGFGLQLLHVLISHGGKAVFPRIVDSQSSELTAEVRKALKTDMRDGNSHLIALVPKVLQGMHDKIRMESEKPGISNQLLKCVIQTYGSAYRAEHLDEKLPLQTRILHGILESPWLGGIGPLIKEKIKTSIVGNDFKYFISGGAPLSEELHDFFWSLGIPVYEGYGSTEANVPVTSNRPGMSRRGSVGVAFDSDIILETSEEGELLISGPNLASGYNNRPEATANTWDSAGRLHTRDRAEIDSDGFVFIKGRVDDLIVLSNGKNIEPEPIEAVIRQHPLVKEALVVGHGHPSLMALVILDEDKLKEEVQRRKDSGEKISTDRLIAELRVEIREFTNSQIEKKTERIFGVLSIPEPTVGNGYTPTLKLQRKKLIQNYENVIRRMFTMVEAASDSFSPDWYNSISSQKPLLADDKKEPASPGMKPIADSKESKASPHSEA